MWPAEGGVGAHRCERTHASCLPYLTCARVLCLAKGAGATFLRSAYVLGLVATGNFAWYNRKVCALPCALSLSCLLAFSCLCEGLHASVSSAGGGSGCVWGAAQRLEPHFLGLLSLLQCFVLILCACAHSARRAELQRQHVHARRDGRLSSEVCGKDDWVWYRQLPCSCVVCVCMCRLLVCLPRVAQPYACVRQCASMCSAHFKRWQTLEYSTQFSVNY